MYRSIYDGNKQDVTNWTSETFLAVNSCGIHVNVMHRTIREQGRVDWHLLYVESGELIAVLDGEEQAIRQGGWMIYAPDQRQEYWLNGGVCYWMHFAGTHVETALTMAGLRDMRCVHSARTEPGIRKALDRLVFDDAVQSPTRGLQQAADLLQVLAQIGRVVQDDWVQYGDDRLRKGIIHMNRHYQQPASLEEYAAMAGLSTGRYMHVFKEATGMSPYAYLLKLRFTKAAELLQNEELSISEVANAVGVEDPLYFSRMFKKRFGVSPEGYRKGRREKRTALDETENKVR